MKSRKLEENNFAQLTPVNPLWIQFLFLVAFRIIRLLIFFLILIFLSFPFTNLKYYEI